VIDVGARDRLLKKRYGSGIWRRLSNEIRTRDGQCMVRTSKKCSGRAEVADHIIRPEEGGAMYDPSNLRAACRSCNFQRHNAAYFREKSDRLDAEKRGLAPFVRGAAPRRTDFPYHVHRYANGGQVCAGDMSKRWDAAACPPGCSLPR
jgi:hypothetical protein